MSVSRREPAAWAVALLLAGIYLLTTGGHTYASDEEQMLAVAASLARHGSFDLSAGTGEPPRYSSYGPGQPLAAVPLYLAGQALAAALPAHAGAWAVRAALSWLNPLVTAATAALIVVAARRLGYGRGPAVAAALIYGLATFAWPHSKTFFAEPLAAALTFAAFTAGLARGPRALLLAGLLAGLACAVKIQAGLALPLLGLWLIYQVWSDGAGVRSGARSVLFFGLGALGALGLLGLYQWALFGSPLSSGYGAASGVFDNDLGAGLYGLLLSPGKGVLWYAPPLLLLPLGLALLWPRSRGAAALCGALALATLLFYAKVIFWHGDGAWGPRYLNMALPFMALPLAAVWERRSWPRAALIATCLVAAPVQLGGVLINLNAYLGVQRDAGQRYYVPGQSPIIGHLRLAAGQFAELYGRHLAPDSIALLAGFSYSEGEREGGAQLPRWSLPEATVVVRPPAGAAARVDLALSGCRPAPLTPARATLLLDGAAVAEPALCPPRRLRLLLPGRPASLGLRADGWEPAAAGIDRRETLGLYLSGAAAWSGGRPLALRGDPLPVPPMPAGPVALRQWSSDYRIGHWDLWAWYLAHAGLPAGAAWAVGLAWAGAGLALIGAGILKLRRP